MHHLPSSSKQAVITMYSYKRTTTTTTRTRTTTTYKLLDRDARRKNRLVYLLAVKTDLYTCKNRLVFRLVLYTVHYYVTLEKRVTGKNTVRIPYHIFAQQNLVISGNSASEMGWPNYPITYVQREIMEGVWAVIIFLAAMILWGVYLWYSRCCLCNNNNNNNNNNDNNNNDDDTDNIENNNNENGQSHM